MMPHNQKQACFLLSYDCGEHGNAREAALREFDRCVREEFRSCWNGLDALWIIFANATADIIRDRLQLSRQPSGSLLVVRVNEDVAWAGLQADKVEWLVNNL